MRKSVLIALIVAIVCMMTGVVLSGAALVSVGFHFEKLDTIELTYGDYTITEDFSDIEIYSLSADVRVKLSEDDVCRIEYATRGELLQRVMNGTLCVEEERADPIVYIGFGSVSEYVTLYLPRDTYEKLTIHTTSGDIYVFPAFEAVKNAEITSTSGDISFIGTVSDRLTAESTSGEIVIREPNAKIVHAETTSGDVTLSAVYAQTVSVKTTSGEVELDSVTAKETLTVSTNSGDIELYCDAGEIYLESTSGDIEGSIGSAKHYIVDTTSGTVRIPPNDTSANICEIHTTSGDIEIKTARDAVNSFDKD